MTQHDIRASLYAPLRVLIYENEEGKTCVEYDRPSSLFGQFGNDRISPPPPCSTGSWRRWWRQRLSDSGRPTSSSRNDGRRRSTGRRPDRRRFDFGLG